MAFDVLKFEAEVALKLILTDQFPAIAQDALEAGRDGPRVLRMAILQPIAGWEVDQALPPMLEELGCKPIPPKDAALRLAILRAQRIASTGEDPLDSLPYFQELAYKADDPEELIELAYLDDDAMFLTGDIGDNSHTEEIRTRLCTALEELLSPELRESRRLERKAAWEREQTRIKSEWPYVLHSVSGRALLKRRCLEKIEYLKPILWIELVGWIFLGWAFSSWRAVIIGYAVTVPVIFALSLLGEYIQMRRERRDILLRRGVPISQIALRTRSKIAKKPPSRRLNNPAL